MPDGSDDAHYHINQNTKIQELLQPFVLELPPLELSVLELLVLELRLLEQLVFVLSVLELLVLALLPMDGHICLGAALSVFCAVAEVVVAVAVAVGAVVDGDVCYGA